MKKCLLLFFFFTSISLCVQAQERVVTGRVTSTEDGSSLPGVNVVVKGTTTGTVTDADGRYSLSIPASGASLVFSFIGLQSQEITVGERSLVDVSLALDVTQLSEIVVTGQGIEKESRSLGYAIQTVNGSSLSQKSETNVLNTLQGKIAGVNIVGASGAPGASTNINIRGINSFGGSNQPLIVVDGIIFSNAVNGGASVFSSQPSNRLADISPENIESINVLKGPAASVLYGSRAATGVIVITTKSGKRLNGATEINVTSSINFQNVYGFPKLQNRYGQGTNNDFLNNSGNSWGPEFGGTLTQVTTLQGNTVPYQAYPDNIKDFFNTGRIIQNGVNLASGNANQNASLSISSTLQDGIIPNSSFDRNSVQLGGSSKIGKKFSFSSSLTYVNTKQTGNPQGNGGSAMGQITRIPRSYDLVGSPYKNATGGSVYYSLTQNHPLWSTENETVTSKVDRAFGFIKAGINVTDWLNVSYRVTADIFTDRRKTIYMNGSARAPQGNVTEQMFYNSELNGDLLITGSKDNFLKDGLNINFLLGQNINQRSTQQIDLDGASFAAPFFPQISNTSVFSASLESTTLRRLVGHYGQVGLSYRNFAFLELSGRVDQSSTLPKNGNAYFYPAISGGFVITDAFKIQSNAVSYAKLRASAARVGNDAGPYLLNTFFASAGFGNNVASVTFPMTVGANAITGFFPSSRIGNLNLTPEFTTSYEGGVELQFLKGRISLDAGYFRSENRNQIFNVSISNSSGYATQTTNVGLMTNKGWEIVLTGTPLSWRDFSWEVSANFTRIRNKVVRITDADIANETSAVSAVSSFIGMTPSIREGFPFGVLIGSGMARNPNGELLINPTTGGFATTVAGQIIADPNPDWLLGVTNTFTYKGLSLSILVDTRQGGDVLSFGVIDLRSNGSLAITGIDRDQPRILPGVIQNSDGTYSPNNIQISSQAYWGALGGLGSEAAVFDATVYRLREMTLSYSLPKKWLTGTPMKGVNVGLSGRNLFFYAPGTPSDPELNVQGAGNAQGLDQSGAPNTRNYGANIKITF